jgi:hypothetical protein
LRRKYKEDKQKEIGGTDPASQDLLGCLAQADYVIMNDGTPEALADAVDGFVRFAHTNINPAVAT